MTAGDADRPQLTLIVTPAQEPAAAPEPAPRHPETPRPAAPAPVAPLDPEIARLAASPPPDPSKDLQAYSDWLRAGILADEYLTATDPVEREIFELEVAHACRISRAVSAMEAMAKIPNLPAGVRAEIEEEYRRSRFAVFPGGAR